MISGFQQTTQQKSPLADIKIKDPQPVKSKFTKRCFWFYIILKFISGFATEVQKASVKSAPKTDLTQYKDGQLVNRTAITLKKQEDI